MEEGQVSAKPKPAPRKRKPKMHPAVKWLRTAGVGAAISAWAAFVLADWFWVAVTLIYLGIVALAVDVWLEPDLHDKLKWRIGIVLVLLVFAGLFSWGIVFVPAPLPVSAFITDGGIPTRYSDFRNKLEAGVH
jgi:hypothetical protein